MDLKSKIILIFGPTASGKSNFSVKLAKKINGEIINADSMQVYKELKILSARPNLKDYQRIKHHLYGFHNVKNNFSTGNWLKFAIKKIKEVRRKKKTPIFVGGTGLYFKALTDGLVSIPNIPIRFRNKIRTLHKTLGQKRFYQKLIRLDPNSKEKINPTDVQRSIRAYEVKEFTKKSWKLPEEYYGNRYSCMVHGIGLCDEWPMIRYPTDGGQREGSFEKNMTITVETYIGKVAGKEGVKLEQQYLVGENGLELMSHHPLEDL